MDAGGPLLPLDHDQEGWDAADAGMAEAFVPDANDLHGGDDAATPPSPALLPPHPLRRRRPGPLLRRPFWSLVGAGSVALGTAAAAAVVCRTFPVMDEVPARSSHQIRPTPVDNLFFPESVPDLMNDDSVWASIPRDGTSIAEMHDTTFTSYQLPSPAAPLPGASPFGHLSSREFQRGQGTSVAIPDRHSDDFAGGGFSTVARLWGSALVLLVLALLILLKMAI